MAGVVRRITDDDWADWRAARLRSLRDDPSAFGGRIDQVDDREGVWRSRIDAAEACFLASLDGEVVGLVAADRADHGIELQSMFVAEPARGLGIGRALVDAVVRHAAGRSLRLAVVQDNTDAQAVYERCGFRHDGAGPDVNGHLIMHHVPATKE